MHLEVGGGEVVDVVSQILRDGERLEKNFGQKDRAADIEVDAAVPEICDYRGQEPEVGVGSFAAPGSRSISGRMLVDDVRADERREPSSISR